MNANYYSRYRTIVRALLVCTLVAWPLTGIFAPLSAFALAVGILLAYAGISRGTVQWGLALFVSIELLYGMGIGIVSLPFLVCIVLLSVVRRWMSIPPLADEPGWAPVALIRATVAGCVCAVVVVATQSFLQAALFGAGMFRERVAMQLGAFGDIGMAAGIIAGILIVLHRLDVPFRRVITYGI